MSPTTTWDPVHYRWSKDSGEFRALHARLPTAALPWSTAFNPQISQPMIALAPIQADTADMRPTSPTSAAVYTRISHDPSGERLGVQRQEAACLEEAKRRGWSIARVYVDDDRSAFDTRKPRPEYQRLLKDIQLELRDGVMIWRPDRLHRQPRLWARRGYQPRQPGTALPPQLAVHVTPTRVHQTWIRRIRIACHRIRERRLPSLGSRDDTFADTHASLIADAGWRGA
jgi:Resolvase, N terminal domain